MSDGDAHDLHAHDVHDVRGDHGHSNSRHHGDGVHAHVHVLRVHVRAHDDHGHSSNRHHGDGVHVRGVHAHDARGDRDHSSSRHHGDDAHVLHVRVHDVRGDRDHSSSRHRGDDVHVHVRDDRVRSRSHSVHYREGVRAHSWKNPPFLYKKQYDKLLTYEYLFICLI